MKTRLSMITIKEKLANLPAAFQQKEIYSLHLSHQ